MEEYLNLILTVSQEHILCDSERGASRRENSINISECHMDGSTLTSVFRFLSRVF